MTNKKQNKVKVPKQKMSIETKKKIKEYTSTFYKGNMIWFILAFICVVLLAAFNLGISYFLQRIIDIAVGSDMNELIKTSLLCLAMFLSFIIIYFLDSIVYPKFIYKATRQYKEHAFKALMRNRINFFEQSGSDEAISALTNDLGTIETNYIASIFSLTMNIFMFFGAIIMMFVYNWMLSLVALALSLAPLIVTIICGSKLGKLNKAVSSRNTDFMHFSNDVLKGFSVIKSFKAELQILKLFRKSNGSLETAKEKKKRVDERIKLAAASTSIFAQFGVFIFGAFLALKGLGVTPGVIIIFVQLMNFVVSPIGEVPQAIAQRRACIPLIEKLANLAKNKGNDEDGLSATLNKQICIKDLSFSYTEDTPILKNLSFTFEKDKSYAIVGSSGSGKSTLFHLLMGHYPNYSGDIYFDNNELRTISPSSLYDLSCEISQNVFVFDSSIKDNITMYTDVTNSKLDDVIKKSGLAKLVEAKGVEYDCGPSGSELSGGEKQRISIARALLKSSELLLMDEATSALDTETSVEVSNSILSLPNMTKIVITHRLEEATLRKYDSILVMKNGEIAESGNFNELVKRNGLFYAMLELAR